MLNFESPYDDNIGADFPPIRPFSNIGYTDEFSVKNLGWQAVSAL